MKKWLRPPFVVLDRVTSIRPLMFFTVAGIATAFDKHYATWGDKIWHAIVCITGGAFIELLAIWMANDIKRKRSKLLSEKGESGGE